MKIFPRIVLIAVFLFLILSTTLIAGDLYKNDINDKLKKIVINGKTINLQYYSTDTIDNKNGFYKNPENLNLTWSFDIYLDNENNSYQFDNEFGELISFRKHADTTFESTAKIDFEQVKNSFAIFSENLSLGDINKNPVITKNDDGSYIVECTKKDRGYTVGSIYAKITPAGDIELFKINRYNGKAMTDEQLKATDIKQENFIKSNYKNILGYTTYKTIKIVNDVPVIYYSVIMTEDGKYKAQFGEQIVLKISDVAGVKVSAILRYPTFLLAEPHLQP